MVQGIALTSFIIKCKVAKVGGNTKTQHSLRNVAHFFALTNCNVGVSKQI